MKPSIVVFGNCQADWIERGLKVVPGVADRFDVSYVYSFDHPVTGLAKPDPDLLARCVLLIEQRGGWDRFPWADALPPSAEVVTFPALTLDALWPLTTFQDPRNVPVLPEYPFGRFPYGDRLISDWLASGTSREETLARYLSWPVAEHEDLDRVHELGEVRLEMADAACDIKMADEVLSAGKDEPLFYTCNHPRPELLARLASRIVAKTESVIGSAAEASRAMRRLLCERRPNDNIQVPVHPDVARHFGLSWYRDDLVYCCYALTGLSYRDYWQAYTNY